VARSRAHGVELPCEQLRLGVRLEGLELRAGDAGKHRAVRAGDLHAHLRRPYVIQIPQLHEHLRLLGSEGWIAGRRPGQAECLHQLSDVIDRKTALRLDVCGRDGPLQATGQERRVERGPFVIVPAHEGGDITGAGVRYGRPLEPGYRVAAVVGLGCRDGHDDLLVNEAGPEATTRQPYGHRGSPRGPRDSRRGGFR
jgi:hypothetical protein